ncbi:MAG: hypothetical protein LC722_00725 [Actinobacteria bacterium]|nr:hypothetical protein [Actinomycetota bacterium]
MLQPGSLSGSANQRIAMDLHRAEAHRRIASSRHEASRRHRAHVRSFGRSVLHAVLWPVKH